MIFCRCSVGLLFLLLGFVWCYERKDSLQTTVSEGRKLIVHQELQNSTEFPINIKIITVTRRKHNRHRIPHPNPQRRRPSYQPPSALPPVPSPIYPRPPPTYSYLAPPWYPPYPPVPYQPVPYPIPPYVPTVRWSQSLSPPPSPSTLSDPLPSPSLDTSEIRQPTISASPSPSSSTSSHLVTLPSSAISTTPSPPPSLSPSPTPPTEALSSPASDLPPSSEAPEISQPTISTSLAVLPSPSSSGLEASISSPLVTKADYCEVVVFLCNLERNSDIPEPPAQFCEHFNPSCAATNLLSSPTQALTWLCQMFPSHWMCNAPVKTPNNFCNQFASHWTCLANIEFGASSILLERAPERPKQVTWFCQHFPTDRMCEDPVMPHTGLCKKFNTHCGCAGQESLVDDNSQPPAGLESFCNLVPTYWMCESPIQPPAGFCDAHPGNWACETQSVNVEAQTPLCLYFPCEDTKASKHHMDHFLPVSMLLKYSDVQIPHSGSIRIPSELLKAKRREPTVQAFAKPKPVRVVRPNKSVYQPVDVDYQQRIADLD